MRNFLKNFKNIYLNNILILILILIIFFIIYYLYIKIYDKFKVTDLSQTPDVATTDVDSGATNAEIYLQNSDKIVKFNFPKSDIANTGPIKFVDADDINIVLGKYPNNWTEEEILDKGLTVTVIKIPRGPSGEKGEKGDSAVFDIEDTVSLEEINSDNLKINAKELNLNARKINLNNSICFGDNNTYCIDKNFINYLKDTNNLIEEKKTANIVLESKEKDLDKCRNDLEHMQEDMETNYFSKQIHVPSLYIETKKCNADKEKLLTEYDNINNNDELQKNYDTILQEKNNLTALVSSKNTIITDKVRKLNQCNEEKKSQTSEIVNIATDASVNHDTAYRLQQELDLCRSNTTNIDPNQYIPKTEHKTILNDYISKQYVNDNYTKNSDVDTRFKDIYGNFLTNAYVNNNYYKKDIYDAQFDIKCQKKIEDAMSDDPIRSDTYKDSTPIDVKLQALEDLYNSKFVTNKTELDNCITDKTNNYYSKEFVIQNYKPNEYINTNYMLNTDCDVRIHNDYIANDIINRDYIKNDDLFKTNYVTIDQLNKLNTSLEECNNNNTTITTEKDQLNQRINILTSTLDNMDCTDCTEYTKGAELLLDMCKTEKNTALDNELTLKEDIKTLGNFITQLHNNISDKENKITEVIQNISAKTEAHDSDVQSLSVQINHTYDALDEKDATIEVLKTKNQELNNSRDEAVKVILKLQEDIKDSTATIDLTQGELNSKLIKLQEAAKQIDKCIKLEENNKTQASQIADLKTKLAEWEFKAHGLSAASKEINELDFKLQKALYEKDSHGKSEYLRGKKIGKDNTKKIYKYSLFDLDREYDEGWKKGKNLSTLGKEEEFLQEKCNAEFRKGVASREKYVYTDEDMKNEIAKTEREIGTKRCEPKQCAPISDY